MKGPRGRGYTAGQLTVHDEPARLTEVTTALRGAGRKVTLVPTMGALHAGHVELIRHARRAPGASVTVVSIFVNPLQFGEGEDLDQYPRTLEADLETCRQEGVELVFAPSQAAMYPASTGIAVHPGELGGELEGAVRPGHFAGVLTVCSKLFGIVAPQLAYFGEKDYQQLVMVRQLVDDFNIDVRVVGVPTAREADGLAMSSRNRYLDPEQREAATALPAALVAGAYAASAGVNAALQAARAVLDAVPAIDVDYLEVRDVMLGPAPAFGRGRLLVAARLGRTRLLDNVAIDIGDSPRSDTWAVAGSDSPRESLWRN
jgi:pantoate--beta-alanine ligase